MRSWPAYGELTRQGIDDMEPATDADPRGKRDPRDFALWKGYKPVRARVGRAGPRRGARAVPAGTSSAPRWRRKYLGPAFDIHGGGVDLRFPHHENEQAQSRAAGMPFASYWLHNAWITTAGEKMSKSLGNSLLVPEVLKRVRGIELRFYMVSAHYRSHVEFSLRGARRGRVGLPADRVVPRARAGSTRRRCHGIAARRRFVAAMDDDLGTPAAVAVIHDLVREGNSALAAGDVGARRGIAAQVRAMLAVLGLDPADPAWATTGGADDEKLRGAVDVLITALLEDRATARADKDWGRADAIRDRIKAAGIEIEDTPSGPKWSI